MTRTRTHDPRTREPARVSIPVSITTTVTTQLDLIHEGKAAYALRQADIRFRLHTHFAGKWNPYSAQLIQMEGHDAYKMVECH